MFKDNEYGSDRSEYILCAAVLFKCDIAKDIGSKMNSRVNNLNRDSGVVITGYRHSDITEMAAYFDFDIDLKNAEFGYLTSKNRFLDRFEAMDLAKKSGQIEEYKSGRKLFSDSLY